MAEICLYTSKDNVWRQFVAEICLYTSKDNVWRQFAVTPWGTHPDRQRETVTPWGTHPDRQRETVTKPPPYPTSNPNLPLQVKGQPVEANLPLQIKGQSVEANSPPTRPFVHHTLQARVLRRRRWAPCQILRCRRMGPLWFALLPAFGWFGETTMQNLGTPPPPPNLGKSENSETCVRSVVFRVFRFCGPLGLLTAQSVFRLVGPLGRRA